MLRGLYRCEYGINDAVGRSVLHADAGKLLGGNSGFAHTGTYQVVNGEIVAEITDPVTGDLHPVRASTSGVFYARPATRIAEIHKRLGKIAGARPFRDGPLLSP